MGSGKNTMALSVVFGFVSWVSKLGIFVRMLEKNILYSLQSGVCYLMFDILYRSIKWSFFFCVCGKGFQSFSAEKLIVYKIKFNTIIINVFIHLFYNWGEV